MKTKKNPRQVNSRYTLPKNGNPKSYRKWVRANMFPSGLSKYFSN